MTNFNTTTTNQLGGQVLGLALAALAAFGISTLAEASPTQESRDGDRPGRDTVDDARPDPTREVARRMARTGGADVESARERFLRLPTELQHEVAARMGTVDDDRAALVLVELLERVDEPLRPVIGDALRRQTGETLPDSPRHWRHWLDGEQAWLRVRGASLIDDLRSPDEAAVVRATREISEHRIARRGFAREMERNLGRTSPAVRSTTARALGELGVRRSAEVLRRAVDDPAPAVRREATESLRRMSR